MRSFVAAVALATATLAPQAIVPATAQTVAVQYDGDYDRDPRGYNDDDYGNDDPYYDRGRYGRDRGFRSDDRGYDDRYEDRDDGWRYRERRSERDRRRYLGDEDDDRRGVVVKRLTRKDRICLDRHSSYDPETGTFRDGRGGRRPCRV